MYVLPTATYSQVEEDGKVEEAVAGL